MTRQSTIVQDEKILELYFKGIPPKQIVIREHLTSVYVVYEALRRFKSRVSRINKFAQISPSTKFQYSV